jgi:hypothetical protein
MTEMGSNLWLIQNNKAIMLLCPSTWSSTVERWSVLWAGVQMLWNFQVTFFRLYFTVNIQVLYH